MGCLEKVDPEVCGEGAGDSNVNDGVERGGVADDVVVDGVGSDD